MRFALPLLLVLTACGDVTDPDHDHDHNHGVITRIELSFTSEDSASTASWSDPENDGDPVLQPIVLDGGVDQAYTLTIGVYNDLVDPVENVSTEIQTAADEHQFFVTGGGVQSAATGEQAGALVDVSYDDADSNGLPVGLQHQVQTLALGEDELVLTLRHLPAEDGQAVKTEGLAEKVAEGGFSTIGGDNDVQITLPLTVQ